MTISGSIYTIISLGSARVFNNNDKIKGHIISVYIVFLIIIAGFIGILVFEGIVDGGGATAATTRYVGGTGPGNWSKCGDILRECDREQDGDADRERECEYDD